ncbi:ABC transporter ATP-binding protein [Cryobacterium sp. SO2]|uniref:ABC transporter ATP-binding protein n=1 Tax=Cryobacterium sp. SO2 TaxID=1897060 RepID=UPI00223D1ABC|nr:ABC transporter ATP-binding protein [Cryobacterium sp. SO2]WEO78445.1 ABC transporter ATP-binding protein [Cryobacterium sp. SO2]
MTHDSTPRPPAADADEASVDIRPPESNQFVIDGLTVRYGDRVALDRVSATLPERAITAVIGPNGCGKSTLLRALGRLAAADDGRISLGGTDIASIKTKQYARRVAMLPQSPVAPEGLTVADLVARGRDPYRHWYDQWSRGDEELVRETLVAADLTELADRHLDSLSGGQRQRAWIAMALAQRTGVLLLDEPTSFLDVAHQLEVLDLVDRLHANLGVTVVMVLHELSLAAKHADHLVAMKDGRIVTTGTPAEVVTHDVLAEVFGIEAEIVPDRRTGRPLVIPTGLSGRAATGVQRGRI